MTVNARPALLTDLKDVDCAKCALLIIDEAGEPAEEDDTSGLYRMTHQTARLVEAARAAGIPVIFMNDAHLPGIDRELLLWGDHCLAGTPAAQISSLLNVQPGDYTLTKRRYSAFYQTELELLLNELGVSTLFLCGFDTNICVLHTAADAYFRNYDVVVVDDATTSFLVGTQEGALAYMKKCYGALISQTENVISFWEKC